MQKRVLDSYFDKGLLKLNGNDAWFDSITASADAVAAELRRSPHLLVRFLYSALDPRPLEDDPARAQTQEIVKEKWRTYASVSMGPMDMVFRGIMLDAIIRNCEADAQTRLAVALLLSSALPYLNLTAEAAVWQDILKELTEEVEKEAEASWSIPGRIPIPKMVSGKAKDLTVRTSATKVDLEELKAGMEAAVGPNTAAGVATEGNQHWPNANDQWALPILSPGKRSHR